MTFETLNASGYHGFTDVKKPLHLLSKRGKKQFENTPGPLPSTLEGPN